MVRALLLTSLLTVSLGVGASAAQKLPPHISYTYYVEGQPAGKCDIQVSDDGSNITFNSKSTLNVGEFQLELNSTTIADAVTYLVKRYDYEGKKMGQVLKGSMSADGGLVSGTYEYNGNEFPYSQKSPHDRVLFLENYVTEHQILAALAQRKDGGKATQWGIFFPSSYNMSDGVLGYTSEAAVSSSTHEAVCEKLEIAASGSSPYAVFFDPDRGIPVYIAWPGTNTEAFLDDFYGDEPLSRFRPAGQ